jgi:hypothetical protein
MLRLGFRIPLSKSPNFRQTNDLPFFLVLQDPSSSSHSNIKVPDNLLTMVCEKCKGGHHEDKIILCDRCDKGWHMFCLSPPLETVPEGEWICPTCISSGTSLSTLKTTLLLQLSHSPTDTPHIKTKTNPISSI